MSGRSSVERLPPALRNAVDTAIKHGATIDEITAGIRAHGGACSRSAVGRYVKRARELIERQQEGKGVAEAWARALGERTEGRADLLTIEALRTLALFCVADLGERAEPVTAEDVGRLALALRRLDGSEMLRAEREHTVARAAASRADRAAREAGLSAETIGAIRRAIEGEAGGKRAASLPVPVPPKPTLSRRIALPAHDGRNARGAQNGKDARRAREP